MANPRAPSTVTHSRYGVLVVALFVALGFLGYWRYGPTQQQPPQTKAAHPTRCQRWVSLTGAWQRQGLVCLDSQGTWRDRLQSAGPDCILPTQLQRPAHGERLHIAVPTPRKPCRLQRRPMAPQQWITLGIPIPLNQADASTLAAIPGLHRKMASRIVAHRRKHGPFQRLTQLTHVRGIGRKTLARIRRYLTLTPGKDTQPAPTRHKRTKATERR